MATTSTSLFAGNSRYAHDFQASIDRAVAIASLPLGQYENQKADLQGESAELASLTAKVTALGSALDRIASSATEIRATSSDTTVLTATATSDAAKATYLLDIRNFGSAAMSLSGSAAITDPSKKGLSTSTSLTLTVRTDPGAAGETTETFTFSTEGTSLNALRDAINSQAGLKARATIVNVGSNSEPDYRLSIQSTELAPQAIQLNDGTSNRLTEQASGARVTYRLNGGTQDFTSESRTLALSPGVTVDVLSAKSGTPVTLSVNKDSFAISSALANFATSYNAVVDQIHQNRGSAGGALSGNAILGSLASTLQSIVFYEGESSSLARIGLALDRSGHLSLDSRLFSEASKDLSEVTEFLGSSTAGFIRDARAMLDSATGPSGSLTSASEIVQKALEAQDQRIAENQERIDNLRTRLEAQMAAADALIAQMEQQATYFTNMFKAMAANSGND